MNNYRRRLRVIGAMDLYGLDRKMATVLSIDVEGLERIAGQKAREKMVKALRMEEWKAEVIGNVTDHVNILIRKHNQRLDFYLKKQEEK